MIFLASVSGLKPTLSGGSFVAVISTRPFGQFVLPCKMEAGTLFLDAMVGVECAAEEPLPRRMVSEQVVTL